MKKISIVGAGNVGANAAFYIAEKKFANVMMIDVAEGRAQGKALDLMQAGPIREYDARIEGSNDMKDLAGSDLVVIAAGQVRKPEMSRLDLLGDNMKIVEPIVAEIVRHAPEAVIIVVTEPVDTMTYFVLKKSGFKPGKVIGMTGVLDSSRLREFISKELNVSTVDTTALVVGGHHDQMVILPRYVRVEGIPVLELLPAEKVEKVIKRTRDAGSEILSHLKVATAAYAPAASIAEMSEAIIKNTKRILCVSACLQGEYGLKDICIGVPVVLGKGGVEKIIELQLTAGERKPFDQSVATVRNTNVALGLK